MGMLLTFIGVILAYDFYHFNVTINQKPKSKQNEKKRISKRNL